MAWLKSEMKREMQTKGSESCLRVASLGEMKRGEVQEFQLIRSALKAFGNTLTTPSTLRMLGFTNSE
jgi:hypothetical protein